MYLYKIEIENFRLLKKVELLLEQTTTVADIFERVASNCFALCCHI